MLRDIMERMRAGWLAAAEALAQVEEVESEVIRPTADDVPESLRDSRLGAIIFRNIKDEIGDASEQAAVGIESIIRDRAIVGWKDNVDCQKSMRQAIDDFLFELGDAGGASWTLDTIDRVVDMSLERARAVL